MKNMDGLYYHAITEYGSAGAQWFSRLDHTIQSLCQRWALNPLRFEKSNHARIVRVIMEDGVHAILKLCVPGAAFDGEVEATRLMQGSGMVRLLKSDLGRGAVLLEAIQPGTTLAAQTTLASDMDSTIIAGSLIKDIRRPLPDQCSLPHAREWLAPLFIYDLQNEQSLRMPRYLVEKAQSIADFLLRTTQQHVILHGDLHHYNILKNARGNWTAIDPHGVIGDPAMEPSALLRNPMPRIIEFSNFPRQVDHRCIILSELLELSVERIRAWAFVMSVLCAIWDRDQPEQLSYPWDVYAKALAATHFALDEDLL